MDRELEKPEQQTGSGGDKGTPGAEAPPPVRTSGQSADENRGRRAPREGSGVVVGSGASAGGGGGAEDYDSDAGGGGGRAPSLGKDNDPKTGAGAPVSGSR